MVGRKNLHALYAVLHALRGIAVNRETTAVCLARHTREGHHQTGWVVGTAGKTSGFLHRQHHAAGEHGGIHRRLLVHARLDDHLLQFHIVLAQGDVDDHLLGTGNEDFLHHAWLVSDVVGLDGVSATLTDGNLVVAVDVGYRCHVVQFRNPYCCANQRFARDGVFHCSAQGLSPSARCAADNQDGGEHPMHHLSHLLVRLI